MSSEGRSRAGRGLGEPRIKKDEAIAIAGKAAAEAAYGALEEPAKPTASAPPAPAPASSFDEDEEYESVVDEAMKTIPLSERRPRSFRPRSFDSASCNHDVVAEVSWGSDARSVRLVRSISGELSINGDLVTAPRWALDAVMAALASWRDGR